MASTAAAMPAAVSTVVTKPIPALYTVYVLRSTVRHASLYIGSTPDPPRRLKQHNGALKGGAVRTSRATLRPWAMVALVSGFPGAVAALKFEWALTNPHLSLHIPSAARLSVARPQTQKNKKKKKGGRPRRPPASMQSVVANLHLLLGVPSFARWPLRLHVFAPEVLAAWDAWCATAGRPPPPATLDIVVDTDAAASADAPADAAAKTGVHAMPVDYAPLRDYVDKARDIFAFERASACAVCREALPPGPAGLYAVCPNAACEAVGHLRCWSAHLLAKEEEKAAAAAVPSATATATADDDADALLLDKRPLVPVRGHCPDCGGAVVWADMMKELTLRLRAPKEVDKLVKAKRKQEKADAAAAAAETAETAAAAAAAAADRPTVVVEIDSDSGGSQTGAQRVRKTATTATTAKTKTKDTTTTATTTKPTKPTKAKVPKAKASAADTTNTKITKTARVTKRKDGSAKNMALDR